MHPALPANVHEAFATDIHHALERLRSGQSRVQIPPQQALFRKRPNAHFHPTPEFFIQTGGATDFECPGKSFRLRTGDLCVLARGVPHAEKPIDTRTPYSVLVCMQSRETSHGGFFLHRGRADPARRIRGFGTLLVPAKRTPLRYLDDMAESDAIPRAERPAYVRSLAEIFLLSILGELKKPHSAPPTSISPFVAQVQNYVRTHLAEHTLSVAVLAKALGCSPDHLTRRFRAEIGLTPLLWINRERVALACDLLAENRLNVSEIAWTCGFNEASYFIRVFRTQLGLTPKMWRAQENRRH